VSDGELVAAALRTARARQGWTLAESACRLGWTPDRLRWLEQGFGELHEGEDRAVIILYGFEPNIARAVERLVRSQTFATASPARQRS
jgi:transcriptional regulator with XRE-family HTH domain